MYTIEQARNILRVDGSDNDEQITALVSAIPDYLKETTGRFILWQWYYGENSDVDKVQRVIDCLLKALSAERAVNES
jgi:hypothetical protein